MPEPMVVFQLRGLPVLPKDVQITGFGLEKITSNDAQLDKPAEPPAPEHVCP